MPASGRSTRRSSAYEGFDHNAQSLRVVTELERRYPRFDGLNLTWETLEGLVKHNGPLLDAAGRAIGAHAGGRLPFAIRAVQEQLDLELHTFAGLEAQVAAICRRHRLRLPRPGGRPARRPARRSPTSRSSRSTGADPARRSAREFPGLEQARVDARAGPPHDHRS